MGFGMGAGHKGQSGVAVGATVVVEAVDGLQGPARAVAKRATKLPDLSDRMSCQSPRPDDIDRDRNQHRNHNEDETQ